MYARNLVHYKFCSAVHHGKIAWEGSECSIVGSSLDLCRGSGCRDFAVDFVPGIVRRGYGGMKGSASRSQHLCILFHPCDLLS